MSSWGSYAELKPRKYKCHYCDALVGSNRGFVYGNYDMNIYICPNCDKPTFFDYNDAQYPSPSLGNVVDGLPVDIESLYNEARKSTSAGAYTSAVLVCRKLLMNIAVSKGAEENQSFLSYIEFLATHGFVPPGGKSWVDHIRLKGNEANHEIKLMNADDALNLVNFTEMLLKFIFEFPSKLIPKEENK